jgi:response regulator RpfG family c-di-GMP phosphodiesterase
MTKPSEDTGKLGTERQADLRFCPPVLVNDVQAIKEKASSESPNDKDKLPRRGTETVLLVEDEDGVRKFTRQILEMQGYRVLEARNGKEAIELEQTVAATIHLLLTDVVMPDMNGRQLAESILPRRQGLKVLYMSGYTDDAIVRQGVMDASHAFLQKPYSLLSFARKVREVLDGQS